MQVKVNAFPAVYINTFCSKHECSVEIVNREQKKYNTTAVIGLEIRTLQCKEGGTDCTDFWYMTILSSGDVTVSQ